MFMEASLAAGRTVMPRSVKFCRAEMMTLPDWHHQPVIEELLSHRLVAVERLSWEPVGNSGRREVGPVRMVFDNGYGLALSGSTAWTLDMWVTSPGDDSWLNTYDRRRTLGATRRGCRGPLR